MDYLTAALVIICASAVAFFVWYILYSAPTQKFPPPLRVVPLRQQISQDASGKAITVPVPLCARCGGTHSELTFQQFAHHSGDADWSHFSFCPTTGEPICLRVGGGDVIPGIVGKSSSAHSEALAEIRSIVGPALGHGLTLGAKEVQRILDALDREGVPSFPERENLDVTSETNQ